MIFFFPQTYYHLASYFSFFPYDHFVGSASLEHLPENLLYTQESVLSPRSQSIVKINQMTRFFPYIFFKKSCKWGAPRWLSR